MTNQAKSFFGRLRLSPLMTMALAGAGAMTAAGAAFLVYAILGPVGAPVAAPTEWTAPAFVADAPPPQKLAANDVQTLSRPLFSKSRRPAPPAAPGTNAAKPEVAETPATTSGLSLTGIIKKGPAKKAYIVSTANPGGEWFDSGATIDAWTISAIGETAVTLKNGDKSARLELYSTEPAPDAAPPAAGPAFPIPPPPPIPPPQPQRSRQ